MKTDSFIVHKKQILSTTSSPFPAGNTCTIQMDLLCRKSTVLFSSLLNITIFIWNHFALLEPKVALGFMGLISCHFTALAENVLSNKVSEHALLF